MKTIILATMLGGLLSAPVYSQGLEDVQKKLDSILAKAQEKNRFVGLSILAIDKENGSFKKHYGFRDLARTLEPNDDTMYEIGSITKVFTRLALLAQGKIKPEDLLSKHLPEGVRVPKPQGQEITIKQLMTHTGSLRFSVPCVYRAADPEKLVCYGVDLTPGVRDPYIKGSKALTYEYVTAFSHMVDELPQLIAKPGTYHEYSNAGFGLLGNLMEDAHSQTFESLLADNFFKPLGMTRTKIDLPCLKDKSCKNFAWPHQLKDDLSGWEPWDVWMFPGMPGVGEVRSSLADMERFLAANMNLTTTKVGKILAEGQQALPDIDSSLNGNLCKNGKKPKKDLCNPEHHTTRFGWETLFSGKLLFHNGQTGGSSSMILFRNDHKQGVVVLANNSYIGKAPKHFSYLLGLCAFFLMNGQSEESGNCKALTE